MATTLTIPDGMQGFRETAENLGYQVAYDPVSKNAMVNGQDINMSGLQNIGGHYYGTQEQINTLLAPFQSPGQSQAGTAIQQPTQQSQTMQPTTQQAGIQQPIQQQVPVQQQTAQGMPTQQGTSQTGLQPIRGVLSNWGYTDADIGYDNATGELTFQGKPLDKSTYILGQDGHYYVNPDALQQQLYSMGINVNNNPVNMLNNYQNPYEQMQQTILQQLQQPFEYNPEDDKALKLAEKQMKKSVMESMAESGILNSSATAEVIASKVNELIPQYYDKAYQRYQQNFSNLMSQASLINQMSSSDFDKFKTKLDVLENQREEARQARIDEITMQEKKLQQAMDRTNLNGYVSNDDALILGVAPGTLSQDAQKRAWDMEDKMSIMKEELKNQKEMAAINHKYTMDEISYRADNAAPKTTDYKKDPDFATDVQWIIDNPDDAEAEIKSKAQDLITKYGTDGYMVLIKLAQGG